MWQKSELVNKPALIIELLRNSLVLLLASRSYAKLSKFVAVLLKSKQGTTNLWLVRLLGLVCLKRKSFHSTHVGEM